MPNPSAHRGHNHSAELNRYCEMQHDFNSATDLLPPTHPLGWRRIVDVDFSGPVGVEGLSWSGQGVALADGPAAGGSAER